MQGKTIAKIADFSLLAIWSAYMSYRMHFPKYYPPLNRFDLPVLLLMGVVMLLNWKFKMYDPWREHIEEQIIRSLLFFFPFAIAFALMV